MSKQAHWFGSDEVIRIYEMLKGFDEVGFDLQNDKSLYRSEAHDFWYPESCVGALKDCNGQTPDAYMVDTRDVLRAAQNEDSYFQDMAEYRLKSNRANAAVMGDGQADVMLDVRSAEQACRDVELARTPMRDYVSEDRGFNMLLKTYTGMVVMADVLAWFQDSGMELILKPFTKLKLGSVKEIRGIREDFIRRYSKKRLKADMLNAFVYARLDRGGLPIYWIKPVVKRNGKSNVYSQIAEDDHCLYSPRGGNKFLWNLALVEPVQEAYPSSPNPRDVYLAKAESLIPGT